MTEGQFPKDDGEILYASEVNNIDRQGIWLKQIASNSDYNDANDIMLMLSSTKYIAFDDSAKDIVQTINSGGDWTIKLANTTDILNKYYVNPNNPNYIIFFSDTFTEKVWYSEDAGNSWSELTLQGDGDQDKQVFSITDTGRIYTLQSDGGIGEIWYTDNGGTDWTQVTGHQAIDISSSVQIGTPKNEIIAYMGWNGVTTKAGYSLDNGSSWIEDTDNTEGKIYYALYIDSDNYVLAIASGGADGGVHIVKWKGTVISSSSTVNWARVKKIFQFDTNFLIWERYITASSSGAIEKYDSSGRYYMCPGGFTTIRTMIYHGQSDISSENRICTSPVFESTEQREMYSINQD